MFTISLKFLQPNILGTSLTVKVIASIILYIILPPDPLAMYCKTFNSLKKFTFMFKYRFTPPNVCIRSMQSKQL